MGISWWWWWLVLYGPKKTVSQVRSSQFHLQKDVSHKISIFSSSLDVPRFPKKPEFLGFPLLYHCKNRVKTRFNYNAVSYHVSRRPRYNEILLYLYIHVIYFSKLIINVLCWSMKLNYSYVWCRRDIERDSLKRFTSDWVLKHNNTFIVWIITFAEQ